MSEVYAAHKVFCFATVLNLNGRLATLVDDLEGKVLHVRLDLSVFELAADETLGVKDTTERKSLALERTQTRAWTYVLTGFMAIWFLAASPMSRSLSEKDT